jgi:hypothetical protein
MPQRLQAQPQSQSAASSMHGGMLDERPAGGAGGETVFVGRVVSIVPNEGAIVTVDPQLTQKYGPVIPPAQYSAVFVRGDFSGAIDGAYYRVFGVYAGHYHYTAVGGAYKTVLRINATNLVRCLENY